MIYMMLTRPGLFDKLLLYIIIEQHITKRVAIYKHVITLYKILPFGPIVTTNTSSLKSVFYTILSTSPGWMFSLVKWNDALLIPSVVSSTPLNSSNFFCGWLDVQQDSHFFQCQIIASSICQHDEMWNLHGLPWVVADEVVAILVDICPLDTVVP